MCEEDAPWRDEVIFGVVEESDDFWERVDAARTEYKERRAFDE